MSTKVFLSLIFGILILFAFTGCEESSVNSSDTGNIGSGSMAQARMIAIENKKLKEEIKTQEELLAQCQQEKAEIETKNAELATQLMEALSEMAKNVDRLQAENNTLREEVKMLKAD